MQLYLHGVGVNVHLYLQGAPVFELWHVQQVLWSDVTQAGSLHPEHRIIMN